MESKTSDLDARLQEITHQRAKLQKPRQGALPRSDQCDCLAGAMVLGGFQGWVQAQHSTGPSRPGLPYTSSYQTARGDQGTMA